MRQGYSRRTKEILSKADKQIERNIRNLEGLNLVHNDIEDMLIKAELDIIALQYAKKNY